MHQKDLGTVYSSFRLSREVAARVLVKAGAGRPRILVFEEKEEG